jgi:hypothetical protein
MIDQNYATRISSISNEEGEDQQTQEQAFYSRRKLNTTARPRS